MGASMIDPEIESNGLVTTRSLVRGRDTKNLILDAAEALFSTNGFDGVSMRDITGLAGVRLALATYHFTSKELLFESVVERRMNILNLERLNALADVIASGNLTVENLLKAFMQPYFRHRICKDQGWRNYSLLIAQLAQGSRWLPLIEKYFNATTLRFRDALCDAMPDAPIEAVARGLAFAIQLMVSELAGNERVNALSNGTLNGQDVEAAYQDVLPFLLGGFEALARAYGPATKPEKVAKGSDSPTFPENAGT